MADSPKTFAQDHAERLAQQTLRDIREYQCCLPSIDYTTGRRGLCRADAWNISNHFLDGDFLLDELLAKRLVAGVIATQPVNTSSTPMSVNPVAASNTTNTSWLHQYLFDDPKGQKLSAERFEAELSNAALGPGNIANNANAAKKAVNAAVQSRTTTAVKTAARTIESAGAGKIVLNRHMDMYFSPSEKKVRIRINGLPTQIVMPALGKSAVSARTGIKASMGVADSMVRAQAVGTMAAGAHWSGTARYLNGKLGGGILTFGPSAAIDAYNSFEPDLHGDSRFNGKKFMVASVKSQSGNLLGVAGTFVAGAVAISVGVAGAPVILIGLGAGILVQAVWGWTGASDWTASKVESALKP
jgi:hypothetical protein